MYLEEICTGRGEICIGRVNLYWGRSFMVGRSLKGKRAVLGVSVGGCIGEEMLVGRRSVITGKSVLRGDVYTRGRAVLGKRGVILTYSRYSKYSRRG